MGALAAGATFNHIARETNDVARLVQFYREILGFESIESPKYEGFEAVWLILGDSLSLHLVERMRGSKLPECPWNSAEACRDPSNLPRGHHISFGVSNFDSFVQALKEKGIECSEKS